MIIENFREYLDELIRDGYTVRHDEHGSDPDLIDPGGNPIETWRADYPYEERMDRDDYEEEKYRLQIELLKFQDWSQETGMRPARAALSSGLWSISTRARPEWLR